MKLKRIMAMVLCFAMVLSTMSFNVFAEETTVVAKIGDTPFETLSTAIDAANADDEIDLCANVEKIPTITKAITIDGNGYHVTAKADEHQFGVIDGTVTLKNLVYDNGTEAIRTDYGNYGGETDDYVNLDLVIEGCIFNDINGYTIMGGQTTTKMLKSLTVTECTFNAGTECDNYMIYAQQVGELTITDCTFNGNGVTKGAIHTGDSLATATVATISGGSISGVERGIQICNRVDGSSVSVDGVAFDGVTAAEGEKTGAIYVYEYATTPISATNNTFDDCTNVVSTNNTTEGFVSTIITTFTGNTADNKNVVLNPDGSVSEATMASTEIDLSEGSYTITEAGEYTVNMGDESEVTNTLTIKADATVTLNDLYVWAPANNSAISIEDCNVKLIVSGNNSLFGGDNGAGIYVAEDASVEITGASDDGSDWLEAVGNRWYTGSGNIAASNNDDSGAAGIGGTWANGNSGAITINNVYVTAIGTGVHGSGIGSGSGKVVGDIVVKDACVLAQGGYYSEGGKLQTSYGKNDPEGGAAIGGGGKTASTIANITIDNSEVNAYGGSKAAGIGANFWCSTGTITIKGDSVVNAYGGSSSAGIGTSRAGDNGVSSNIVISGGTVTATGGDYGAGIGAGYNADSLGNGADASALPETSITISGGTVIATGGMGSAAIGGGYKSDNINVDITGGTVTATAGALVEGKTVENGGAPAAIGSGANGSGVFENSPAAEIADEASITVTAYEDGKSAIEGMTNEEVEAMENVTLTETANPNKVTEAEVSTFDELVEALADGGEITVAADIIVDEALTIPEGVTVTVAAEKTLRVLDTLTNNGAINGDGKVSVDVMVYVVETVTPYEGVSYDVTATKNGALAGTAPECNVAYEISLDSGNDWFVDSTNGKAQAVTIKTDGTKSVSTSFQSAFTSAKTGETVHMLKDAHVQSTNPKNNNGPLRSYYGLILEGNGHTIYTDLESSGASNEYATIKFTSYLAGTGPEVNPVLKNLTIDSQKNAKADLDFVSGDVTFTVTMYNVNLLGNCQYANFAMNSPALVINKSEIEVFDCVIPKWDAGSAKSIDLYSGNYSLTLNNKCTVYGGTYTKDVSAYLADGLLIQDNGDGTYGVKPDPAYGKVAKIGDNYFETLADALTAAKDGETIALLWEDGDAPIAMNGAVYGKSVTVTGTATVDWSKGFLFVGRGGAGNGTLTFDNANLTSASDQASTGIHVSGREKDTDNKYDGTLIINNSTIELDYLINKGTITLDNSTLTVKNGFAVGGRPASETESGEDATATMTLNKNSMVVVNNHNGMGIGYEAIGIVDVNSGSTFEATQDFLITEKGTMNIDSGSAKINGTLTVKGKLASNGDITGTITKADAAVIEITGGTYTQDVSTWCVNGYVCNDNGDGTYSVVSIKPDAYTVTVEPSAAKVRYNNGTPDTFTVKYIVTGGDVMGATAWLEYDTTLFTCDEDPNAVGRILMNSVTLKTDENGETLIKELNFKVKVNPETDTTYKFLAKYVQVVSDYDAAGSGAQNGFVENVIGAEVTVVAQYDVTLPEGNSIVGNTFVDKNTNYTANVNNFDENKIYTIKYTMGDGEEQTIEVTKDNANGEFVIETVTGDIVFTEVTSKLNYELVLLSEAVSGYTLVMVKDGVSIGYTYNGEEMFAIDRYVGLDEIAANEDRAEFSGDILGAESVRAILVRGGVTEEEARAAIEVAAKESDTLTKEYDVNRDGSFWFNDAVTAHGCYSDQYTLHENKTKMNWYLSADVNGDFVVDTDDYDDAVDAFWATVPEN